MDNKLLSERIWKFIAVLTRCRSETTYAADRALYDADIALATRWVVALQNGADVNTVVQQICSSSATKHVTDYWKQGKWGELESAALQALQDAVSCREMRRT